MSKTQHAPEAVLEATDAQLERIYGLIERLAALRGRKLVDVTLALLNTKTLEKMGYDGSGHLTVTQAEVAAKILEGWLEKAEGLS